MGEDFNLPLFDTMASNATDLAISDFSFLDDVQQSDTSDACNESSSFTNYYLAAFADDFKSATNADGGGDATTIFMGK